MAYGAVSLEKKIKENIRNYRLENLYFMNHVGEHFKYLAKVTGADILLTDRHGEKAVSIGNFADFQPDVVKEPGIKLRVQNRTVGHLYIRLDNVAEGERETVEKLIESSVELLSDYGEMAYQYKEFASYLDEQSASGIVAAGQNENIREDILTGVCSKTYFEKRIKIIDRSEIVPIATICANINDWKFVNDHFGDEESDRLIQVVASILKNHAKQDYVIGRTDGDVFYIIIPMPEDNETENYCQAIQQACRDFEDKILTPSVALGYTIKTNVEECISNAMSDAEYEMFNHKFEMKNEPEYKKRLEKGILK